MIAATGRFLTFSGGSPPIGHRMRPDPKDRAGCRIVRETDRGLVLSGRIGMPVVSTHASWPFIPREAKSIRDTAVRPAPSARATTATPVGKHHVVG